MWRDEIARLLDVVRVFWSRDVAEFLSSAGGVADAELYTRLPRLARKETLPLDRAAVSPKRCPPARDYRQNLVPIRMVYRGAR